jgi:hypothetical protein
VYVCCTHICVLCAVWWVSSSGRNDITHFSAVRVLFFLSPPTASLLVYFSAFFLLYSHFFIGICPALDSATHNTKGRKKSIDIVSYNM